MSRFGIGRYHEFGDLRDSDPQRERRRLRTVRIVAVIAGGLSAFLGLTVLVGAGIVIGHFTLKYW